MQHPLISIGILCYNACATIGRALDSALGQDWHNKEILIVDDGSNDNSRSILYEYKKKYPIIRIIEHDKNLGTPAARNTIFSNFRGEYLAFFDDDDVSNPTRIRSQFNRLTAFPHSLVLCYCNRRVVPIKEGKKKKVIKGIGWAAPEPHGYTATKHWLLNTSNPAFNWGSVGFGSFMAHRDSIQRIGFCDNKMLRAEDIEYAIQASFIGAHFISVDETLLIQHITEGSDKNYSKGLKAHLHLVSKYSSFLKQYNSYNFALIMAYAQAHELCNNKWRFKILRSIAKRISFLTSPADRFYTFLKVIRDNCFNKERNER